MIFEGWVDEVEDGIVWGRLIYEGYETEFKTPLLDTPESARVSLQPGSYIYVVNGFIMVNNAMWTTHDLEMARERGKQLFQSLGWDRAAPVTSGDHNRAD